MWLGSEHNSEVLYGGPRATYGWMSMGIMVLGPLIAGMLAILRKDVKSHKKWMYRWYGSMWGAFLVFRVIFFAGGLLRWHQSAMVVTAIWVSAPIGCAIAEWVRLQHLSEEKP